MLRRITGVAMCAGVAALAPRAPAQDVIVRSFSETRMVESACVIAQVDCFEVGSHETLARELAARPWKLVIFEWYFDLAPADKELLLPALEQHLDRGGGLLLMYTNLDEWPELQELVGVRTVGDVTSIFRRRIWSVDPPHPTWPGPGGSSISAGEDYWPDNGDFLDPSAGGYTLVTWDEVGGPPAMVLTRSGRVMTYGFDLDAFEGEGIDTIVAEQIQWLLACQADVDRDGELTLFDFLAFQNLFATGDPAADFAFDGRLDFFDFLEFQDQFAIGCP